jgi:hypothetical protein
VNEQFTKGDLFIHVTYGGLSMMIYCICGQLHSVFGKMLIPSYHQLNFEKVA